jgi:hypothetical protein
MNMPFTLAIIGAILLAPAPQAHAQRTPIVFCGFMMGARTSILARETEINHHGFKADLSQIKDSPQKERIINAVKRQIEIVDKVQLSTDDLNFFKSVPIVILPAESGTPGVYGGIKKTVFLKARDLAPNRPILLHELLHAYHHLKITGGFQNAQIHAFYQDAKNKYPDLENEYFLSNAREFFAVTASIYLFGDIPRAPYKRSAIRKAQPDYYQYLETLFRQPSRSIRNG